MASKTIFGGLFIGIDRYQDVRIGWLSGARRDAAALHALFSDSLGDTGQLLTDEGATSSAIREALTRLAVESQPEDIVVIAYSGHGTDDHRIVTYDANVDDLPGTCLSLDDLADLVSAIPGSHLLCILDCCFSGGMGAKVLSSGLITRSPVPSSVESRLARFAGDGRLVLTASAENEEAHESSRHGHGLLTYRLLEALQGIPEVRSGDQISILKLVEHVTRLVQGDSSQMGRRQTPTLRGKADGAPLWPVLTPGARYAALFPDRVRSPASDDISSLKPFGFSDEILAAWSTSIPTLNELQVSAINDFGVLDGENVIVTAPTSSGKTMIGELAAIKTATTHQRAVFLLPMRALVNDKYEQFTRTYSSVGIRTIRATGEHSDQVPELLRGQFDIALLTYEKYCHLALANPHVLELAGTVVIDEAQMLTERSRGSNLEFLLTLLNNKRGQDGVPQVITLSAVVGDLCGLDRWLGGRNLHSTTRPVPLTEGVIDSAGSYRYLDASGREQLEASYLQPLFENGSRRLLIPLLQRLTGEGKKVLVFRQSKGESVACAVYLSRALGLPPATGVIDRLSGGDASTSSQTLKQVLGQGIAFHNSDLDREERMAVEEEFRNAESPLRVIVATPTLAMGVNTPASAVAIVGLTHPGAQPSPYSVAEYKNMVGRAGRLGITDLGESFLIPEGSLDANRAWNGYVNGQLERLVSQLVPDGDPRTLMLRVLAAYPADVTGLVTEDAVIQFLDSSFAAFQAREGSVGAQWDLARLRQGFSQLVGARLVEAQDDGYRLTPLGRFTGESGVHVDSIIRLVHSLQSSAASLNSIGLIAAAQLTVELDDVWMPANARARNTEVPRWPRVLGQQNVPNQLIRSLQMTAPDAGTSVRRAKRAVAAAYWVSGVPMEQIELELTQHMPQRGGIAGTIRGTVDRTRDLLPAVAAVVHELAPGYDIDSLVDRTMLRLELGIPAELVDLVQAVDLDLARASWLVLHAAELDSLTDIQAATEQRLSEILGSQVLAERLMTAADDALGQPPGPAAVVIAPPAE